MTASRTLSLRARLWLAGAVGVVVSATLAGWLLGEAFRSSAEQALDRRLVDDVATVAGLIERADDGAWQLRREPADERFASVFSGWYWQVEGGGRRQVSRSLWDADIRTADAPGAAAQWQSGTGPRGQSLRVHRRALRLPGVEAPVEVVVAGDRADIVQAVREFRWLATLAVAAAAMLLLVLLAWQVEWGLRPLRRMRTVLSRVRRDQEVRFGDDRWPREVAPLTRQIDALLDEHVRRVQRARHAAQDLAHALKTPLAVLAAESERPGPGMAALVSEQVARMRAAVDRRLATGFGGDTLQRTGVAIEVDAMLAMFRKMPGAAGLRFDGAVDAGTVFAGNREDFVEMLGNLLDNAAKWARTRVEVRASCREGRLRVEVADDGPGIDADAVETVVQRGVRLDERKPGSGLGLSIVDAIATSYGGGLRLHGSRDGLVAELSLPAEADPDADGEGAEEG